MRKAKKKEKQENEVIEISADVKINEDTILEKGDKIEVLGKKVEEEKLTEDHLDRIKEDFAQGVISAWNGMGKEYAIAEIHSLLSYTRSKAQKYDYNDLAEFLMELTYQVTELSD